jgi:hypothetical protein
MMCLGQASRPERQSSRTSIAPLQIPEQIRVDALREVLWACSPPRRHLRRPRCETTRLCWLVPGLCGCGSIRVGRMWHRPSCMHQSRRLVSRRQPQTRGPERPHLPLLPHGISPAGGVRGGGTANSTQYRFRNGFLRCSRFTRLDHRAARQSVSRTTQRHQRHTSQAAGCRSRSGARSTPALKPPADTCTW